MRKWLTVAFSLWVIGAFLVSSSADDRQFVHGIEVDVDGEKYYLAGPLDAPGGASDIPGHTWVQIGPSSLVGKHYNAGPFGAAKWWSSDAEDGALLYLVRAKIDAWSEDKAAKYAAKGYIHYHELVKVSDGTHHPTKVVWLKHIAFRSFTLDGGLHPELGHAVTSELEQILPVGPTTTTSEIREAFRNSVDFEFIPYNMMTYSPD